MKMVYICSPLRGDIEANIKRATHYCEYAAGCGVIPIAPHVAWNGIFDDTIPEKRKMALQLGLELLRRCDEVWVMGDEISQGMRGEIEEAEQILTQGEAPEFAEVNISAAWNALGELIGEQATDDVINKVFEDFCVGK